MTQNTNVIKFPVRATRYEMRQRPMTGDRLARGNAWLAQIRTLLEEVRS